MKTKEVRHDDKLQGWRIDCPGCKRHHVFEASGWKFDGHFAQPTFVPSLNESIGPYPEWSKRAGEIDRCHVTVTAGKITFHQDCTHGLANQTVELPELK